MKNLINEIEKERILNLHKSFTKRQYLNEVAEGSTNIDEIIVAFSADPKYTKGTFNGEKCLIWVSSQKDSKIFLVEDGFGYQYFGNNGELDAVLKWWYSTEYGDQGYNDIYQDNYTQLPEGIKVSQKLAQIVASFVLEENVNEDLFSSKIINGKNYLVITNPNSKIYWGENNDWYQSTLDGKKITMSGRWKKEGKKIIRSVDASKQNMPIKQFNSVPYIKQAQKLLGVKEDGDFGPKTLEALKTKLGVTTQTTTSSNTPQIATP
jgi:hypothetical protein